MTKEIELTKGKVALVDEADFHWLSQWSWYCARAYAGRGVGGRILYMHRLLMSPGAGIEVDHINNDKLDNRRANLRLATHAQNQQNKRTSAHNKSGFKGVSKNKNHWKAMIRSGGKQTYLGIYADKVDAALAYDRAAREIHGEFACLNFPTPNERILP